MSKFSPTAAEVALVNQIFAQADPQKLGVVTGDAAVKIFAGSKLSPTILAEIWTVADEDNNGVLTRKGVAIAVRLLGHAQRGEQISEALVLKNGPVPMIEGLNAPIASQSTGVPLSKSPPPRLPPLSPQDKAKFIKLFLGCGPVNGILSGDKARDVFVKSKLPVDKLSAIWNLADTKNRGALDVVDFTVAMYLIQASMSGQLPAIPSVLPPYVYEQAGAKVESHMTGDSGSFSPTGLNFPGRPVSTLQPQYTGQSQGIPVQMTGQGLRAHATSPPIPGRPSVAGIPAFPTSTPQWDVTPAEKANSDRLFDGLDKNKRGYIEGDVAVPFMVQSKLSEDTLAQIWDLADLNNDGKLTRDGFAVAMHLIQAKMAGKEVPTTLPTTLMPPHMRSSPAAASIPEPIRDLLWDDTPVTTTTPQAPTMPVQSQMTGTLSPQHTSAGLTGNRSTVFGNSDPFASTFTSSPAPIFTSSPAPAPVVHRDLLGDDDDEVSPSPPLQDKSAEIGNVQNQLNSTNRSLDNTKNDRANVERVLAEQAAQLSALQTQLSSAKAAYETETRLLSTLRERHATQTAEIQKTREELIHAESDLSAVRVEKAEIEGSVLRDKEEVRGLQKKMQETGIEIEGIKADLEKLRKEAKQQKGLLAIAKKQLLSRESERAKVEKEAEEARAELEAASKEKEEVEAELAREPTPAPANGDAVSAPSPDSVSIAAGFPLPASPPEPVASIASGPPSPSSKSTNPFERLAMASTPRSQSPFLPFANSVALLTPTVPAAPVQIEAPATTAATSDDPFGFSEAFGDSATHETKPEGESQLAYANEPSTSLSAHTDTTDPLSPSGTDLFMTPPTSATFPPASSEDISEAAASHFPALDAVVSQTVVDSSKPAENILKAGEHEEETTLDTQLKEIEVEESDSDDDEPLTNVKAKLRESLSPSASVDETRADRSASAFDDSFGISSPPTQSTDAAKPSSPEHPIIPEVKQTLTGSLPPVKEAVTSPFGEDTVKPSSPAVALAESSNQNGTDQSEATVSDFDEAFGKVPESSGAPSQFSQFTFDSAFDDNFDFAAATASASEKSHPPATNGTNGVPTPGLPKTDNFDSVFLPTGGAEQPKPAVTAPSIPTPSTSAVVTKPEESRPFSFDDAFGAATPQPNTLPSVKPTQTNGSTNISFDDAFGGHANEALALDNSFTSSVYQPPPGPPPQRTASITPFPTSSQPSSPSRDRDGGSSQYDARRSISPPPRHATPPPRHSSPKPRPSTGSSEKEKPTRHSKLSIRLPFGRKKKHEAQPPVPSALSHQPLVENTTPAAEDDIDAVKQLCSMGFSRTQAIMSLEEHGYDVQRALNSLLGSA
ncbi:hypothetical protein ABKN59_010430 [Abortiporus biennis]